VENERVVRDLLSKGRLLTPEARDALMRAENAEELARNALENAGDRFLIDIPDLEFREKTKITAPEAVVVVERTDFKPLAREFAPRIEKMNGSNGLPSSGSVEDFVDYFRDRYAQMSQMLRMRGGSEAITPVGELDKRRGAKVRLICMIAEKKLTKNGHLLLQLEDMSGSVTALMPQSNAPLIEAGKVLVPDEIIAVDGRLSKDLFIIDSFHQPDLPLKNIRTSEEDVALATISDLHIGSRLFLRKNFERFLAWLRGEGGNEKQRELAGKVKYITIAGDIVDGIGVYSGQEEELEITDIYEQYRLFSEFMLQIPDYVEVIIAPGNHDAVKTADPQPALPRQLVEEIRGLRNMTFVSSPATMGLHGIKTLVYHGTSFDDMIAAIPDTGYEQTEKVMVEVMRRRHVHPIYGEKPITPEKADCLVIRDVPDIFHAGHLHKNGYDVYRGVICVNSGTWQQVTPFQIKQGHKPTPCVLPVVTLANGKINVVHFDRLA
jgi:DNA polymerase II small subunit